MSTSVPSAFRGSKPIRFVNSQGQLPLKRRRINAACFTCRKRKTRCAGERPTCSTCQKNGHACLGYPAADKKETSEDVEKEGRPDELPGNPQSPAPAFSLESHRVPYFRYFGPTAIVPGYKQMVVDVSSRDRRRSQHSLSASSPGSALSRGPLSRSRPDMVFESADELPVYDPGDAEPVHPLLLTLLRTFFAHVGFSFPFLQPERLMRRVAEKRAEPILVDAMCALAARFCDPPLMIKSESGEVLPRAACGSPFAQRAKAATVDTFPCPSVAAVQACLLMAYEGFGADQDSALWMYLGLAIRMAVDLGLQRNVGEEAEKTSSEHERADTFWAVFFLDRVISSGTGRPVTFRDDDFDLALPSPALDPQTRWPAPFPTLVQIIHMYGRVSDVLNKLQRAEDLDGPTMQRLAQMEGELTGFYQRQDPRLNFNAANFQQYVHSGEGGNFILLHFWFHALIIILHQPTLLAPFGGLRPRSRDLLANSHALSMSSAKTIADMLAFAELIDPKSFVGNPFTSQPMYIAACAFLAESVAAQDEADENQKHALLVANASQNYQRCYQSLQQMHSYWGGVRYILTALDQKAKGIWDCETFTLEEYESTRFPRRRHRLPLSLPGRENDDSESPIAWSLTGTSSSESPSLTLLFQSHASLVSKSAPPRGPAYAPYPPQAPESAVRGSANGLPYPPAQPPPQLHFRPGSTGGGKAVTPRAASFLGDTLQQQRAGTAGAGGDDDTPVLTLNSQEIDLSSVSLPDEMPQQWLAYLPGDLGSLFEGM